jgi:hypothetical protein
VKLLPLEAHTSFLLVDLYHRVVPFVCGDFCPFACVGRRGLVVFVSAFLCFGWLWSVCADVMGNFHTSAFAGVFSDLDDSTCLFLWVHGRLLVNELVYTVCRICRAFERLSCHRIEFCPLTNHHLGRLSRCFSFLCPCSHHGRC